jgi:RHS repeat-associated protein
VGVTHEEMRRPAKMLMYGPSGLRIEQINNSTGTVTYLHHDQAGSTRLLTGSTGAVTGKCTYSPYGTPACEGTTTTPLGYDAQYTSPDTGLVYLRARVYDPATAQFLSVDPLNASTRAPYTYAEDNAITRGDPSGLLGGCTAMSDPCGSEIGGQSGAPNEGALGPGGSGRSQGGTASKGSCHEGEERARKERKELEEHIERELHHCGMLEASDGSPPSFLCSSEEGEAPQADGGDTPLVPLPPPGGQPGVPGIKVPTIPFDPPFEPVPVP